MKSSLHSQLNWRTWRQSKGKTPCGFDVTFLPNAFRVVERLYARDHWTWYQLLWPKCRETRLKSNKETEFLSSKGHLLVAAWVKLLRWTLYRLDLPFEVFTASCYGTTVLMSNYFALFRKLILVVSCLWSPFLLFLLKFEWQNISVY